MLEKLHKRWPVIPVWLKLSPVLALILALTAAHIYFARQDQVWLFAVHRLFFLPLFMASLLFGLWGGLGCAAVLSMLSALLLALDSSPLASQFNWITETCLLLVTGAITGALVDRERKENRRLKQAQELATLGQAAAAVAHELKTPLVAIGGFALRIYRDMAPDHPHRQQMRIIVDQVAHMEHLLREMLDYSRPLQLDLQPVSLRDLVREAIVLSSEVAEDAGVKLEVDLPDSLGSPYMDGPRMKQVILNLLHNAVQASPFGGEVRVRAYADEDRVYLEVMDQGTGIRPENLSQIFSPFFTTKRHGTGLGLAISHKIVAAHEGSLSVTTRPDAGSTFTVKLPLKGPA